MVHEILFDNPTTAIMSSIVTFREEKEVKFQCLLPILLQFENEKNICISYLTLGRWQKHSYLVSLSSVIVAKHYGSGGVFGEIITHN